MSIQRTFKHSTSNRVNFFLQSTYNYIFFNRDTHSIIDINNPSSKKFFRMDNFKEAIDNFIQNKIVSLREAYIPDSHLEAFNQSITDHSILEPNYEEEAKRICFETIERNIKTSIENRKNECEWLPGQTVNLLEFYIEDSKDKLKSFLNSQEPRTGGKKSKKRRNKKRKTRKR
tara:strand:+ start:11238 stop:11756 length:519 start_codon:yes stop_codon:yes gene_type:complete